MNPPMDAAQIQRRSIQFSKTTAAIRLVRPLRRSISRYCILLGEEEKKKLLEISTDELYFRNTYAILLIARVLKTSEFRMRIAIQLSRNAAVVVSRLEWNR